MKQSSLYFLAFFTFGMSLALVWVWQYGLRKKQIYDLPNHRSSHTVPTPRAGGIGIFFAYSIGLIVLWAVLGIFRMEDVYLFLGAILVFGVGLWDDFRSTRKRIRILVHFLSAGFVYLWVYDGFHKWIEPYTTNILLEEGLALIWIIGIVWAINLFNFMDGINGIAGMQTVYMASSTAILLAMENREETRMIQLSLLSLATMGFLVWNFPQAKVFLGDCGSGLMGFILSAMGSWAFFTGSLSGWGLLLLGSLFWLDASLTLLKRFLRGENLGEAHRSHAYQILARSWNSHATVTILYMFINLFVILPLAYIIQRYPDWGIVIFSATMVVLTCAYVGVTRMEESNHGS